MGRDLLHCMTTLLYAHAGTRSDSVDDHCWRGGFSADLCCPGGGMSACWGEDYTYEYCCQGWKEGAIIPEPVRIARKLYEKTWKDSSAMGLWKFEHVLAMAYALDAYSLTSTLVEVGVKEGDFAYRLLTILQALGVDSVHEYFAIDTWGSRGGTCTGEWSSLSDSESQVNALRTTINNLKEFWPAVHLLQADSIRSSRMFEDGSVDFVFIDACHDTVAVLADMETWWPKLKPGGLFAGHDISWTEVSAAVEHFAATYNLVPLITIANIDLKMVDAWAIVKPNVTALEIEYRLATDYARKAS